MMMAMKMAQKALLPEHARPEPPPGEQPLEKTMIPVGAHAVFGLATAAAFNAPSRP